MRLYRDSRLDSLFEDIAQDTNPGGISRDIQRLFQKQAGQGQRDAVLKLQRISGNDPFRTIEGISDIQRGTASAAGEMSINADLAERTGVADAQSRLIPILQHREGLVNQERLINREEKELRRQEILGALSGAIGLGGQLWQGAMLRDLLRED